MKFLDLTQSGGFPFDQEALKWMQDGYLQALTAICKVAGDGPVILTGMEESGGSVTDGFFFYHGLMYRFIGGAVQATVVLNNNTQDLIFDIGGSKPVVIETVAQFGSGQTTLQWSAFKRFDGALGIMSRSGGWVSLPVLSGGVGAQGSLAYCVDKLTGMCHLRGSITCPDTTNLHVPMWAYSMASLPAQIQPINYFYFQSTIYRHNFGDADDNGNVIAGESCVIDPTGNLAVVWRKMFHDVGYTQHINVSYPLF